MMRAVLHLFATQPQWLAEHAQAYAELVTAETLKFAAAWKRQVLLKALALGGLALALLLAGVALLLWASLPTAPRAPWVLIVVPLLPLACALGCWLAAREQRGEPPFVGVRRQFEADKQLLREVSAS